MREVGNEDSLAVEVPLLVQPEISLPKPGATRKEWSSAENVHPFWLIKRTATDDGEANAILISQDVQQIMACSFQASGVGRANVAPLTNTFSLSLPIIVNTLPIKAGNEVILKWNMPALKKTLSRPVSAFTQLQEADKRQRTSKAQCR